MVFAALFAIGFRSARSTPAKVAEMALSHAIGDKVEAAYRRGDLLEKRVALMADWAAFLTEASGRARKSVKETPTPSGDGFRQRTMET